MIPDKTTGETLVAARGFDAANRRRLAPGARHFPSRCLRSWRGLVGKFEFRLPVPAGAGARVASERQAVNHCAKREHRHKQNGEMEVAQLRHGGGVSMS